MRFAAFAADDPSRSLMRGQIEGIGLAPRLSVSGDGIGGDAVPALPDSAATHAPLIGFLLDEVLRPRIGACVAIGHRVVHGGTRYAAPVGVDEAVLADLEALIPLARSHQPHNVAGIRAVMRAWPGVLQVACFDTAFHRTMPEAQQLYALPRELSEQGVRRYGFHGLSYESIAGRLPGHLGPRADGRVIVAHLGNGASLCAMLGRRSQSTTMGFTPLEGLVMGRRPGNLDPGIVLHLIAETGMSAAEVDDMLQRRSGLFGLSGISSDMRDLLAADSADARLAVEVFVARLVREIGALAATIGGLDALVFTGGIGENAAAVRAMAVERLGFLGARLDAAANRDNGPRISGPESTVDLLVLPTDEEQVIARHALALASSASRYARSGA